MSYRRRDGGGKREGAMRACASPHCVALVDGGEFCAIHRDRGEFYSTGEPGIPDKEFPKGDCQHCDGSGECNRCDGEGEHVCECGDEHDCHSCQGSGKCDECNGTGKKEKRSSGSIKQVERDRIRRLFETVWAPFVPYDSPWEQP